MGSRSQFLVLVACVSCGAPVDGNDGNDGARGAELSDVRIDSVVDAPVDAGAPTPEPEPAEDCSTPENPHCDPCVYFSPETEEAFPGVRDAFHNAAGRWWRWYVDSDTEEGCTQVLLGTRHPHAYARRGGSFIWLNPSSDEIIDGDYCSNFGVLLVDILTHELGHVYGFLHSTEEGCAMCHHTHCVPIVPSDYEIWEANSCDDEPPPGAYCPE